MKKNCKQFFLTFHLAILLLVQLFSQGKAFSQETSLPDISLSLQVEDMQLNEVLEVLSRTSGYNFAYNSSIINSIKKISISVKDEPIRNILDTIFRSYGVSLRVIDQQIVIYKNGDTSFDKVKEKAEVPFTIFSGKILDANNKKPVEYANISIEGRTIGTITNMQGEFVLKVPDTLLYESLMVSYIGYHTYSKSLNEIPNEVNIHLTPATINIKEVKIRVLNPEKIITNALNSINRNYYTKPVMYNAFYRETSRENEDYVVLSEAIVDIYKSPYDNDYRFDRVRVHKGRKSPFVKTMDTLVYKFQGGLHNSLLLDIVKNPPSFLLKEYFQYYNYKITDIVTFNGENAYQIEFAQKENISYPFYKGILYISTESLAIVGASFSINPKRMDEASNILVRSSPLRYVVKPQEANYHVNFKKNNHKWQLNHIRTEIKVRVRKRRQLFSSVYHSITDMVITNSDTVNIHYFRFRDAAKITDIFAEQVGYYDPDFWGEYNYIKPDLSIEDALMRLKQIKDNDE